MLIYPAIDLMGGQCVRLRQGVFDDAISYDPDPFARLAAFQAAGAAWAHMVDLDGAKAGRPEQHALIGRMAQSAEIRIQAGGGVRTRQDVQALLEAGAARVVLGSVALAAPDSVRAWIAEFGPERLCLALDVRDGEVLAKGWTAGTGRTLEAALDLFPPGAARHILITDVSRDGMLTGPNLDLLRGILAARPDLCIQASGGIADLSDLQALRALKCAGAIIGRALYEGRFTLMEALNGR